MLHRIYITLHNDFKLLVSGKQLHGGRIMKFATRNRGMSFDLTFYNFRTLDQPAEHFTESAIVNPDLSPPFFYLITEKVPRA